MTNGSAVLLTGIPEAATQQKSFCVPLATVDVDTGSSTDEYDWEDVTYNTPSPSTTSSNATAATATVVTAPALASCDVCLNAPRVTVALLPCGRATFCQQCIDTHFSLSCVSMCHTYYCPVLQLAVE